MNAPARIPLPVASEDLWSAEERAHRAAITIHCPNEGEWNMACRAQIAAIRDQASAGLRRCCNDAHGILSEVARIASLTVYAPMDAKQLTRKRAALMSAIEAARALERAAR